jgi:Zn finger protein HypA/HybF involved in hydrogenase expression
MIQKVEMFTIKCDNCGKLYEDEHQGFCAWNYEGAAWEYASEENWIREDDKHYCPNCYEYDDDDNLIIKPVKSDTAS